MPQFSIVDKNSQVYETVTLSYNNSPKRNLELHFAAKKLKNQRTHIANEMKAGSKIEGLILRKITRKNCVMAALVLVWIDNRKNHTITLSSVLDLNVANGTPM